MGEVSISIHIDQIGLNSPSNCMALDLCIFSRVFFLQTLQMVQQQELIIQQSIGEMVRWWSLEVWHVLV